jgi:hypothetical protein
MTDPRIIDEPITGEIRVKPPRFRLLMFAIGVIAIAVGDFFLGGIR